MQMGCFHLVIVLLSRKYSSVEVVQKDSGSGMCFADSKSLNQIVSCSADRLLPGFVPGLKCRYSCQRYYCSRWCSRRMVEVGKTGLMGRQNRTFLLLVRFPQITLPQLHRFQMLEVLEFA